MGTGVIEAGLWDWREVLAAALQHVGVTSQVAYGTHIHAGDVEVRRVGCEVGEEGKAAGCEDGVGGRAVVLAYHMLGKKDDTKDAYRWAGAGEGHSMHTHMGQKWELRWRDVRQRDVRRRDVLKSMDQGQYDAPYGCWHSVATWVRHVRLALRR